MKWFGFFLLVLLLLPSCGPSNNAVDIAQAQSMIEAARAAQGRSDVGRGQTLILVLLTLVLLILVVLATYIVLPRLTKQKPRPKTGPSGRWMSGPNAGWKRIEQPDLYQQMLMQQHWLMTRLLSQSEAEPEEDDPPHLPTDWWS